MIAGTMSKAYDEIVTLSLVSFFIKILSPSHVGDYVQFNSTNTGQHELPFQMSELSFQMPELSFQMPELPS
jgi:hypothetical protein